MNLTSMHWKTQRLRGTKVPFFLSPFMRTLFVILFLSMACTACGQQVNDSLKMTSDDSTFVSNVVKDMHPISYTATKTHHGVVLVMVFDKYTLIETLVDGFVEDLAELTPKGLIVYPRESD